MNPLFEGAQANDSKDLVNFIVMTLHQELNKSKNIIITNNQIIDQTNQMLVFKNFANKYGEENKSLISDIFYGMSGTSTQCSVCNIIKYNFQAYFFLIFPLEEIRKFKFENLQKEMIQMNQNVFNFNPILYQQKLNDLQMKIQNFNVNIYDCFEYNEKIDYFTGENSMYCNNCKANTATASRSAFDSISDGSK